MARILIAGCGYVGQATAALFHDAGWEVEGWTASAASAAQLHSMPYPVHEIDISNAEQVRARSGDFDAIMHCASTRGGDAESYRRLYLSGIRHLQDRFPAATVLFTSSTSVYAQKNAEWVTEECETIPGHETGQVLLETEGLVRDRGGIIARLAGIYGPHRSFLLKKFLEEQGFSTNDRFINQVHRDDIARAIFLIVNRRPQSGEIYNIVDNRPVLQSEVLDWLARRLDQALPPEPDRLVPRKRGQSNKRVSNAKLRGLGWVPEYPSFVEAMEKSILPSFGK